MSRRFLLGAFCLALISFLATAPPIFVATANHTACNQRDGNDADNNMVGTDGCDEFWMRGGNDTVEGRGGGDFLYMGSGADTAYGQHGGESVILGGENGNVYRDKLYGGEDVDFIQDDTSPDDDLACGGKGADALDVRDGDTQDTAKGEENPSGTPDELRGDSDGETYQDGAC